MAVGRKLDARAHAAIEFLREHASDLTGPILIRGLVAALPAAGDRRSWKDAVTAFLLAEVISVYRVSKGKFPYWHGLLYRLNRRDLADQFACNPDQISSSLSWLGSLGLVEIVRRTRIDSIGKPCGTEIYVVPHLSRIQQMLGAYSSGKPLTASALMESNPFQEGSNSPSGRLEQREKHASTLSDNGAYLNRAEERQKADVNNGVASRSSTPRSSMTERSDAVVGGGVAAEKEAQLPGRPSLNGSQNHSVPDQGRTIINSLDTATASRWTPPRVPGDLQSDSITAETWSESCLFCELWEQSLQRAGFADVCTLSAADLKSAFRFFEQTPQATAFFTAAVAICAWEAGSRKKPKKGAYDRFYHCRHSYDIHAFLRLHSGGKLMPQIGQSGLTANTFENLRWLFTTSELLRYGWEEMPVIALSPDQMWENDETSIDFYEARKLPLPPEISRNAQV